MTRRYLWTIIILILPMLGCPEKFPQDARGGDAFGDYVDPVITAIGGAIDDQIDSLFASTSRNRFAGMLGESSHSFFIKEAWAAACARPSTAPCVNESRTVDYSSCIIDSTPFTLDGTVNLLYTGTPNCGFTAVGDTVTRTMSVSRTIPNGGKVVTSSAGGGTKLTITGDNSFNLEILGVRKFVSNTANIIDSFGIDLLTTTPITITGGLARSVRIINGGTVTFGRAHGVLTLSPANLAYSAECCYPISGSIKFTDTADTGFVQTGTVTFPRCGTATIQWDPVNNIGANPYDVSLVSCE